MTEAVDEDDGLPANDVIVTSRRSLLDAFRCSSIQELEGVLDDQYEPWVFIEDDESADECLVVRINATAIELPFPFAVGEIWTCLNDLEALNAFANACDELADQIQVVEGFRVQISSSYGLDYPELREAAEGMGDYPYRDRMGDEASIDTWLEERFEAHFPALSVEFETLDGDRDPITPLSALRELRQSGT